MAVSKHLIFWIIAGCMISHSMNARKSVNPDIKSNIISAEKILQDVNQTIWSADWSPGDQYIAVGGVDSIVRILDPNTLRIKFSIKMNSWIHVVKWHPDGNILAIATLENYVQLLNIATGKILQLEGTGGSRAIGWNYSGDILAVGDLDGNMKIFSKDGQVLKTIENNYPPDQGGTSFLALDWHPSQNIFVTSNFKIRIFDASGKELKTMDHNNPAAIVLCAAWNPKGKYFVIGDYGHNWEGENVPSLLNFWNDKGELMKTIWGSKDEYRNISWNRSGSQLASASDVLRIWSSQGRLLFASPAKQNQKLWGIDWNDGADKIVTTSNKGEVSIWTNHAKLLKTVIFK